MGKTKIMENIETLVPEVIAETSLSLITKAEIDCQIATAKAFPRSIKMFMDRAMSIATINENVAASCNYALPRGGKTVEGPSVRLAEIVCSSYGNIRSGMRVIANDGKTITAQGICHDLETNNCVTLEVKRRITDKYGKTFNEDMQVVTGNAACAIAFRNAVFKVIPGALTQEIFEKTKQVARGTAETLVARRTKAIEWFKEQKVTEKQICEILEVKKIEDIDLDKLSTLSGMRTLVRNGEGTIAELFSPKADEDLRNDIELLYGMKGESMTEDEKINADRILKNNEVKSYSKLFTLLKSK